MKKYIRYLYCGIISIMLLFIYSINILAESDAQTKEFMNNHSEILKSIKECTECINKKGDIRIDFLEEVIHYNEIQICMSENFIKCGDDKNVRNMAKALIKNAMECTTELSEILNSINQKPSINKELEEEYINEYVESYEKMIKNLECKRDDDIGKIFLKSSIKQHESLIELTEIFTKYRDDEKIIETAKGIREKNYKEIKKIKSLLRKV
mgnify:FL=1